ncbi:MAG TPA: DUF4340 domain-containing protein [Methylotenera sp.]|nr:DUF4340 domain-containing protein [Methylotenera sp.]HPH05952.1 DUF4340 domain-containing protein [Methylotenera sp.]HPN00530.1 DUF4340 domain-containing protein [Methylotenera sp.]
MKNRWIINFILLGLVAGLVAFLYLRPKTEVTQENAIELTAFKLADFSAISIEHPTKAAVTLAKVDGFWRLTAPYKTRADKDSAARIISIIAAKSKEKLAITGASSADLEKFGLNNPRLKLKLIRPDASVAQFDFGAHNPVTDEQYVLHDNAVYLIASVYEEIANTQAIELIDKNPLKPTEKVAGFDFSKLEQWAESKLNIDLVSGQWKASIAAAKPQQNELNEWLEFSWLKNPASSVDFYPASNRETYPSFEVKMADGTKVHFDKIQESPNLLLGRPDEGLIYNYPPDVGFTMLNPPINLPSK